MNVSPLDTGNSRLIDFIRDRIRIHGPVSFAWFMEQALYHPEFGYYAAGRCAIGRRGDYFTNVSVGPLFGRLLAVQFFEIWEKLEKIDHFTIVEQGAHHGDFASDVLGFIRDQAPELFSALRYCIVEPFAVLRTRQSEKLVEFKNKVQWCDSIEALSRFVGIYFCNELLDAFPVHRIVSVRESEGATVWKEKFVALKGDQFVFVDGPMADRKLRDCVEALPLRPAEYATEVNLAAHDWIGGLSAKLTRGYLLAVDYGFPRADFYSPHRTSGSLQYRSQHRLLDSPFAAIGQSDITAHVEWTSIAERAEALGLQVVGFTDQHHFLTGIISKWPEWSQATDSSAPGALKTLLHPEMLGRSFQVLALGKNVDPKTALSGFKFARDGRTELGL